MIIFYSIYENWCDDYLEFGKYSLVAIVVFIRTIYFAQNLKIKT